MKRLNEVCAMNCLERKVQKQRLGRIMCLNNIHGFFCKQLCTVLAPLCLYWLRKYGKRYGKRPIYRGCAWDWISHATLLWGEALRDNRKSGCVADQRLGGVADRNTILECFEVGGGGGTIWPSFPHNLVAANQNSDVVHKRVPYYRPIQTRSNQPASDRTSIKLTHLSTIAKVQTLSGFC